MEDICSVRVHTQASYMQNLIMLEGNFASLSKYAWKGCAVWTEIEQRSEITLVMELILIKTNFI